VSTPVVAVINASAATMSPVSSAFAEGFPSADVWHLLDDRLVRDAERQGGLTGPLRERMTSLIGYAVDAGADAVQLACSMYGPVAGAVSHPVPVLASDQAMFDEVGRLGVSRVTVLASLEPAAKDSRERLRAKLTASGLDTTVATVVVAAAKEASDAGDMERLGRVLADAARALDDTDVVVLAQYSLAPVVAQVADAVGVPVLSGPHLAAATLAALLGADHR